MDRALGKAPLEKEPMRQGTRGAGGKGSSPLARRLLTTSKACTSTGLACDPGFAALTKPSSVHAGTFTVSTTKNTSPMVDIEVLVASFYPKMAAGAGQRKRARLTMHGFSSEAPDNVRLRASTKMPPSMLLERAVIPD